MFGPPQAQGRGRAGRAGGGAGLPPGGEQTRSGEGGGGRAGFAVLKGKKRGFPPGKTQLPARQWNGEQGAPRTNRAATPQTVGFISAFWGRLRGTPLKQKKKKGGRRGAFPGQAGGNEVFGPVHRGGQTGRGRGISFSRGRVVWAQPNPRRGGVVRPEFGGAEGVSGLFGGRKPLNVPKPGCFFQLLLYSAGPAFR